MSLANEPRAAKLILIIKITVTLAVAIVTPIGSSVISTRKKKDRRSCPNKLVFDRSVKLTHIGRDDSEISAPDIHRKVNKIMSLIGEAVKELCTCIFYCKLILWLILKRDSRVIG